MSGKKMIVTFFGQNHIRPDWKVDFNSDEFESFFSALIIDLGRFDIELGRAANDGITIDVKSYSDLLNSVRISSPSDSIGSQCVGHIIGKSQNLDLMEDIRRAVNKVAFAPETIAPEEHNRKVCHNCGCGC